MDDKTKDLLERAAWTFLEAAVGTAIIGAAGLFEAMQAGGLDALAPAAMTLGISALAAGCSALKTWYVNLKAARNDSSGEAM